MTDYERKLCNPNPPEPKKQYAPISEEDTLVYSLIIILLLGGGILFGDL